MDGFALGFADKPTKRRRKRERTKRPTIAIGKCSGTYKATVCRTPRGPRFARAGTRRADCRAVTIRRCYYGNQTTFRQRHRGGWYPPADSPAKVRGAVHRALGPRPVTAGTLAKRAGVSKPHAQRAIADLMMLALRDDRRSPIEIHRIRQGAWTDTKYSRR